MESLIDFSTVDLRPRFYFNRVEAHNDIYTPGFEKLRRKSAGLYYGSVHSYGELKKYVVKLGERAYLHLTRYETCKRDAFIILGDVVMSVKECDDWLHIVFTM